MMRNCPITATSQNRRLSGALGIIVALQVVGMLPALLGWRWVSVRGVDKELVMLATFMVASVIGAVLGTLILNWRFRAPWSERLFVIVASLFTLPSLVGLIVAIGGIVTGELAAIGWASMWSLMMGIPIVFSMPFALVGAWVTQRAIDTVRTRS